MYKCVKRKDNTHKVHKGMVIEVCESCAYDILRLYQNPLLGFFSIQHKDEEGEETNLFDG